MGNKLLSLSEGRNVKIGQDTLQSGLVRREPMPMQSEPHFGTPLPLAMPLLSSDDGKSIKRSMFERVKKLMLES